MLFFRFIVVVIVVVSHLFSLTHFYFMNCTHTALHCIKHSYTFRWKKYEGKKMTHFFSLSSRFSMCSMYLLNILSFCLSLSQYFIISLYLSILVCLYYFKHVSRNKKVSFHQVFFSPSKSLCEIVNEMKEKYVDIEFMNEKFKQWYMNSNYPFLPAEI